MNDDSPDELPDTRSWRDIPQEIKPRAMTPTGRRRLLLQSLRTAGTILVLGAIAWGGWEIIQVESGRPAVLTRAVAPKPITRLHLATDGVLDHGWLARTLAIPPSATLLDVQIEELKARLERDGQVAGASVTKRFPDGLAVNLNERSPIARVLTEASVPLLVARDGVVYPGHGYDPALVETLPWLKIEALTRRGAGFAPIPRMSTVADLLGRARLMTPYLYEGWRVIDLTRMEADAEIEVQSFDVPRIVFSTEIDFFTQLSWLDYAWDRPGPALASIDLSLGPQVVATFDPAAPARARSADFGPAHPGRSVPPIPAFPDFSTPASNPRAL